MLVTARKILLTAVSLVYFSLLKEHRSKLATEEIISNLVKQYEIICTWVLDF